MISYNKNCPQCCQLLMMYKDLFKQTESLKNENEIREAKAEYVANLYKTSESDEEYKNRLMSDHLPQNAPIIYNKAITKIPFEWKKIGNFSYRAKVIGGWLINNINSRGEEGISESCVFIPDPYHEWEI